MLKAIPQAGEVSMPVVRAVLEAMLELSVLSLPGPAPESIVDESYRRKATAQ